MEEMKLRPAFIAMVIETFFEVHPLSCPNCGKSIMMSVSEMKGLKTKEIELKGD